MQTDQPIYINTPLYYVNAKPHIGSAYTTMICDTIARFWRLYGSEVHFLTGVDEHGGKIEKTAESNGLNPQEHCDQISSEFIQLWEKLNIKHNYFSRTSSERHRRFVKEFWNRVKANDDIYEAEYKGLYCIECEDFKTEKELEDGCCPIHKKPIQEYAEKNYFFKLSNYTEKVREYLTGDRLKPAHRIHEVKSWLDEGLKDFPISRRSVKWGIPVPDDPEQTIYVWFDALLGYLSGLVESPAELESFPGYTHILGKDILRFHAVYWPAMLMSAGLPLPQRIIGHGFLTKDGQKMGKATGNIIDPDDLIERFGIDAIRFYFTFQIPFGSDGDYSEDSFIELVNSYLANRLGNLCSRVLKLFNKNMNGEVPEINLNSNSKIAKSISDLPTKVKEHIEEIEPDKALKAIFDVIDEINLELSDIAPWKLFKSENPRDQERAQIIILESLNALWVIANLLNPFIPNLSEKILSIFNTEQSATWEQVIEYPILKSGMTLHNPGIIFARIQAENKQ